MAKAPDENLEKMKEEFEKKLEDQAKQFQSKIQDQQKHYDQVIKKITDLEQKSTDKPGSSRGKTSKSRLAEVVPQPRERRPSTQVVRTSPKKRASTAEAEPPAQGSEPGPQAFQLTITKSTGKARRKSSCISTDSSNLQVQTLDVRQYFNKFDPVTNVRPRVNPGELWEDKDFPLKATTAVAGELDWKRPQDFRKAPTLYSSKTTKFDIEEGGMGICWLIPILMSLPDRASILKKIMPDDAYKIGLGPPEYDGVFHCRFWRFGRWEDVYVDDRLPMFRGTQTAWSVTNRLDKDEMWPSLVEKAYAKFMGSYEQTSGGWATSAFLLLTGGVTETIKFKSIEPDALIGRLENALFNSALVFTNVKEEANKTMGLKAHDLYILVQIEKIPISNVATTYVRVNNVLGTSRWLGQLPREASQTLDSFKLEYGEFWIKLDDLLLYFDEVDICGSVPDMNTDMTSSQVQRNLGNLVNIRGEWHGPTAAGTVSLDKFVNENAIFDNPRFLLSVPGEAAQEEDGKEPVLLQIFQGQRKGEESPTQLPICIHFYKVDYEQEPPLVPVFVLTDFTSDKVFRKFFYTTYRYRLEPGNYLMIPSSLNAGEEDEFFVRVFSRAKNVECAHIEKRPLLFVTKCNMHPMFDDRYVSLDIQRLDFIGEWRSGLNSGGQVRYRSFARNPQYVITGNQSINGFLLISLKQPISTDYPAIGFHVMLVEDPLPCTNYEYMKERYRKEEVKELTGKNTFVKGAEVEGLFALTQKDYLVIILFQDEPDQTTPFSLTLGTNCPHPLNVMEVHASQMKAHDAPE